MISQNRRTRRGRKQQTRGPAAADEADQGAVGEAAAAEVEDEAGDVDFDRPEPGET